MLFVLKASSTAAVAHLLDLQGHQGPRTPAWRPLLRRQPVRGLAAQGHGLGAAGTRSSPRRALGSVLTHSACHGPGGPLLSCGSAPSRPRAGTGCGAGRGTESRAMRVPPGQQWGVGGKVVGESKTPCGQMQRPWALRGSQRLSCSGFFRKEGRGVELRGEGTARGGSGAVELVPFQGSAEQSWGTAGCSPTFGPGHPAE